MSNPYRERIIADNAATLTINVKEYVERMEYADDHERLWALRDTVEMWEKLAKRPASQLRLITFERADRLCEKYFDFHKLEEKCRDCPVMKETGEQFCEGTPMDDVLDAFDAFRRTRSKRLRRKRGQTLRQAIQSHLDFLRGLLAKITAVS